MILLTNNKHTAPSNRKKAPTSSTNWLALTCFILSDACLTVSIKLWLNMERSCVPGSVSRRHHVIVLAEYNERKKDAPMR